MLPKAIKPMLSVMGLVGDWTIPAQIGRDYLNSDFSPRSLAKHKGSSLPSAILPRVTSYILNNTLRQFAVELPRSPGSPE